MSIHTPEWNREYYLKNREHRLAMAKIYRDKKRNGELQPKEVKMTKDRIANYERLLGKKYSNFTESEIRQCENYERERTVKPTGEKRLKRERSAGWNKETSFQLK